MTDRTDRAGRLFLALAACSLALVAVCGWIASVSHGWAGATGSLAPYQAVRALHLEGSLAWVLLALLGVLTVFVPRVCERPWAFPALVWWQLGLALAASGTALAGSQPAARTLAVTLIGLAWFLFLVNVGATLRQRQRPWPVQLWMWVTGAVLLACAPCVLLLFSGHAALRDPVRHWESVGVLLGPCRLISYGIAIHLAQLVAQDRCIGASRAAFAFFWVAVLGLALGWVEHAAPAWALSLLVRRVAFLAQMVEWTLLLALLWSASARCRTRDVPLQQGPVRVVLSCVPVWIGVSLVWAALASVPSMAAVVRGTHADLAHSMGASIGIHAMVLWGAGCLILLEQQRSAPRVGRVLRACLVGIHVCLLGAFGCLLLAGTTRGTAMVGDGWSFATAMEAARPFLQGFACFGAGLMLGVLALAGCWVVLAAGNPAVSCSSAGGRLRGTARGRSGLVAAVLGLFVIGLGGAPWVLGVRVPAVLLERLPAGRSTLEEEGRVIFVQQGCWHCHLEGAQPPTPVPLLLSEGGQLSAGWHAMHLYEPHWARAGSSMPSFAHLFETPGGASPELSPEGQALVAYLLRLQDLAERRPFERAPSTAAHDFGSDDLFRMHCANCHGSEGRGDGVATVFLRGESMPRDFQRGLFRIRSTPDLPTDADLLRTISRGMPGSAMPRFDALSLEHRRVLVGIVKGFARGGGEDGDRNPFDVDERVAVSIPEEPPSTPESLARGLQLLEQLRCGTCHGDDLRGLWASERDFTWTDEAGRPVLWATDLVHEPFKGGEGSRDLYRMLFVGMGGSPMPSYGEAVPDHADRWAVVQSVLSLRATGPSR